MIHPSIPTPSEGPQGEPVLERMVRKYASTVRRTIIAGGAKIIDDYRDNTMSAASRGAASALSEQYEAWKNSTQEETALAITRRLAVSHMFGSCMLLSSSKLTVHDRRFAENLEMIRSTAMDFGTEDAVHLHKSGNQVVLEECTKVERVLGVDPTKDMDDSEFAHAVYLGSAALQPAVRMLSGTPDKRTS